MKAVLVCFPALFVFVFAELPIKDYLPKKYKIDDNETLTCQLKILQLFRNIYQSLPNNDQPSDMFEPQNNLHLFQEAKWIDSFLKYTLLEKGEIFSVYYQEHLDQAILLFRILYDAKNFDTFYKTAVWSRSFVNEGVWLYSVYVALAHRPDTFGLILPPIYEINPFYFFSSEIITDAQKYKQKYDGHSKNATPIIDDDLQNRYTNLDSEQLMSYFTEDVSLNSFYYYYHIFYPWWMDGKEFGLAKDHRGEIFYYVLVQLVARYNLERLSNDLDEVNIFDFTSPLDFGYHPSLRYPNGVEFPNRPHGLCLKDAQGGRLLRNNNFTYSYSRLRNFAFRIQNVVDLGRAYSAVEIFKEGNDGLEILSNLLEGNPNSPDLSYYGTLQVYARNLLGYAPVALNRNKAIPAATQHYETTLRDPASWRLFRWILNFYTDFYKHLAPHKPEELQFPGVNINSVVVDELTTFFEPFYSDLSSSVFYSETNDADREFSVKVKQNRLNHSPLAYNISVSSDRETSALIKVFLGPKYDRYGQVLDITENYEKFYVLDYFGYYLRQGENEIARFIINGPGSEDRTSYKDLLDRVNKAIRKEEELVVDGGEAYWAFPNRLLLPKGTAYGLKCQLYVILIESPEKLDDYLEDRTYKRIGIGRHTGNRTLRFPLDRKIEKSSFFVSNSFITDVIIRHMEK